MGTLLVNIAQMKISSAPDTLCAMGLGSCMGVVVYDPIKKIGGMIHILLPSADEASGSDENRIKFANPGISDLVAAVIRAGADKRDLVAKIAGGASMLNFSSRIGERNCEESRKMLDQLKINIIAQDTGGTSGRTVSFDLNTGVMVVSTLSNGKYNI